MSSGCSRRQADLLSSGVRGLAALGNANEGGNAGDGCLNVGNGPSNANANYGAALNNIRIKSAPLPMEKHIER